MNERQRVADRRRAAEAALSRSTWSKYMVEVTKGFYKVTDDAAEAEAHQNLHALEQQFKNLRDYEDRLLYGKICELLSESESRPPRSNLQAAADLAASAAYTFTSLILSSTTNNTPSRRAARAAFHRMRAGSSGSRTRRSAGRLRQSRQ